MLLQAPVQYPQPPRATTLHLHSPSTSTSKTSVTPSTSNFFPFFYPRFLLQLLFCFSTNFFFLHYVNLHVLLPTQHPLPTSASTSNFSIHHQVLPPTSTSTFSFSIHYQLLLRHFIHLHLSLSLSSPCLALISVMVSTKSFRTAPSPPPLSATREARQKQPSFWHWGSSAWQRISSLWSYSWPRSISEGE